MNLRKAYRNWAEQYPGESRWIFGVWAAAAAALTFGIWAWIGERKADQTRVFPPAPAAIAAAPSGSFAAAARRTESDFPADPAVWDAAAAQLSSPDAAEAGLLRRDAELFSDLPLGRLDDAARLAPAISLLTTGGIQAALQWLDQQPSGAAADLRAFRADLLARRRLLPELKAAVGGGAWGPADPDTLDLAFAASAARDRQHSPLERDLWAFALQLCGSDRSRLRVLERLSLGLGLDPETAATYEAEIDLPSADLAVLRRYAVWAARRGGSAYSAALSRWKAAAPAEAAAYAQAQAAVARRAIVP